MIQCFGMTAGAISWLTTSHISSNKSVVLRKLLSRLLIVCGLSCIPGILIGQNVLKVDDHESMILVFKVFSIVFGLLLTPQKGKDLRQLAFGNIGAVNTLQLGGSGRQEQHVPAAQQIFGTDGIDDGSRIGPRRNLKGQTGGEIGFYDAG